MVHRWDRLTMVHWPFDPREVQELLPNGLEVDTAEGMAWVGLVAFRLSISPPALPPIPWVSRFLEINVRTYVRGPDGGVGIRFLSLDAARLGAVAVARAWYGLPYMWARMRSAREDGIVWYESRRRWPGAGRPRTWIAVALGGPLGLADLGPRDRFLIGRWRLYAGRGTGLVATDVEHPPWPLRRAMVLSVRDGLLQAAGLPQPLGEPIAHYSPGIEVRFAPRRRLLVERWVERPGSFGPDLRAPSATPDRAR